MNDPNEDHARQLDLFDMLADTAEGNDLEYKAAKGGLPGSFWETYSAMANSQGGTIVLGVAEKQGKFVWEGVPDPVTLRNHLWSQLNDRNKVSSNLLTEAAIRTLERNSRHFVVVQVPRASRMQRPVYIGPNPMTGTYRRAEEGDYRCSDDEVRRMLADQSSQSADARIVEHFGMTDFDPETLKQYRNLFASRAPDHAWLLEDDEGLLFKLGALRRERATSLQGATVAGLLMFGREQSLREALPSYHVDFREKLAADPAVRWSDRVHPDGTWHYNIFQFYQRVIQRLSADLKMPFQLTRALDRRDDSPTHEALREAVVNALVHADHFGQGGVVIERYADRIELSNPGSLLLPREQLLRGGISECRNKSLQLMFQMMGRGEKAGSGLDTIRSGWRAQHWRSPRWEESLQPDRVRLSLPMVSLLPVEVDALLHQRFGERFSALSPTEVQALVTAKVEGSVTNARMQELTGQHPANITSLLRGLVRQGLLHQQNQRRWSSYRVVGEELATGRNSHPSEGNSHPYEAEDSHPYGGNSHPYEADSPHSEGDSHPNSMIESPLWPLAARARGHRLRREALAALILRLCTGAWLSTRQLAELLGRDPANLQAKVLTAMVKAGQLRLQHPEVPNRPDQAYQTEERAT